MQIFINKMIKRIHVDRSLYQFRDRFFQAKQFCEIFTNTEHLKCTLNNKDDLLFLINYLPELSTLKISWQGKNHKIFISQLENQLRKLNVIYDLNYNNIDTFFYEQIERLLLYFSMLFDYYSSNIIIIKFR
jgi:hypothetical protein